MKEYKFKEGDKVRFKKHPERTFIVRGYSSVNEMYIISSEGYNGHDGHDGSGSYFDWGGPVEGNINWWVFESELTLIEKHSPPEELLKEARIRYPKGTVYIPAHIPRSGEKCTVGNPDDFRIYNDDIIESHGNKEKNGHIYSEYLYTDGKWAEIVSTPVVDDKLEEETFQIGKWYKFKSTPDLYIRPTAKDASEGSIIWSVGKYDEEYSNSPINIQSCELLDDLSVIQEFLPDGHPDKLAVKEQDDVKRFFPEIHLEEEQKIVDKARNSDKIGLSDYLLNAEISISSFNKLQGGNRKEKAQHIRKVLGLEEPIEKTPLEICKEKYKAGMTIMSPLGGGGLLTKTDVAGIYFKEDTGSIFSSMGKWQLYNNSSKKYAEILEEPKKSLVGRYLKALVDKPVFTKYKKGDYIEIKVDNGSGSVICTRSMSFGYGEYNWEKTKVELMPEGFHPVDALIDANPNTPTELKVGQWVKIIDKPESGRPEHWCCGGEMDKYFGQWVQVVSLDVILDYDFEIEDSWVLNHSDYTEVRDSKPNAVKSWVNLKEDINRLFDKRVVRKAWTDMITSNLTNPYPMTPEECFKVCESKEDILSSHLILLDVKPVRVSKQFK